MKVKIFLIPTLAALTINFADAAIDLDFSQFLPGSQPDQAITGTSTVYDGQNGLLFGDVADVSSSGIAMVAILEAITAYSAVNTSANGKLGDDIQVNQAASSGSTSYRLSFYDSGTLDLFDNEGFDFEFDLVIYDIDGGPVGLETFTILTPASYQLTDTTNVNFDGQSSFSNNGSGDIDAPIANATDLNEDQEDISVILSFTNQSIVNFNFTTTGGGSGGRNFFLDGQDFVVFDDATATGINSGSFVPEPSAYACLLGFTTLVSVVMRRNRLKAN
ncbi:MAG: hypothetical protein AAF065_15085 [Verrucomicrobiota bacterium]